MEKTILTVKQAAKLLQIDPNTVYRWSRAGKFPASKIGKEWRVLHSDVIKFIENNKRRTQPFSKNQEAELITSLLGRREIPVKFQYFGEGADLYTSFLHPKELGGESEFDILSDNQNKLLQVLGLKNYNLIDLGSGDGKKAAYLISLIKDKINGYFPIDSSLRILDITSNNISLAHPSLSTEIFQEDFEQGNVANVGYYLHRRYENPNLFIFLGNTMGNISDAHRVLINLGESMREDDLLVVGLAHFNKNNIPTEAYNTPGMIEWLWTVPTKLGIKKTDAKIYCTFNESKRQIEGQLEFINDWSKMFGTSLLNFSKGQKVRLVISRRFTKEDIFELFAQAGFKIELLLTDKDKNNALVVCRLHNWEKNT